MSKSRPRSAAPSPSLGKDMAGEVLLLDLPHKLGNARIVVATTMAN